MDDGGTYLAALAVGGSATAALAAVGVYELGGGLSVWAAVAGAIAGLLFAHILVKFIGGRD
jgi:hypothetical protein